MGAKNHQRQLAGLYLGITTADERVFRAGLGLESFIDAPECNHTSSDTLFESPDAIVAACLGVAGGITLTRFILKRPRIEVRDGKFVIRDGDVMRAIPEYEYVAQFPDIAPPFSWKLAASKETNNDVSRIITAGFDMARAVPIRGRDQAYREASFQVPYELARLNPDAPRFRLEDMGPLSLSKVRQELESENGFRLDSPINIEKDARIFLYFPNDSKQATAAFLAINAEYQPLEKQPGRGRVRYDITDYHIRLTQVAMNIWLLQNVHWARRHEDVLHRIGPPELPVIISFRDQACGSVWDAASLNFPNQRPLQEVICFYQKEV